jgi:hypothetical protein
LDRDLEASILRNARSAMSSSAIILMRETTCSALSMPSILPICDNTPSIDTDQQAVCVRFEMYVARVDLERIV